MCPPRVGFDLRPLFLEIELNPGLACLNSGLPCGLTCLLLACLNPGPTPLDLLDPDLSTPAHLNADPSTLACLNPGMAWYGLTWPPVCCLNPGMAWYGLTWPSTCCLCC